jgi:hypothetical protein
MRVTKRVKMLHKKFQYECFCNQCDCRHPEHCIFGQIVKKDVNTYMLHFLGVIYDISFMLATVLHTCVGEGDVYCIQIFI